MILKVLLLILTFLLIVSSTRQICNRLHITFSHSHKNETIFFSMDVSRETSHENYQIFKIQASNMSDSIKNVSKTITVEDSGASEMYENYAFPVTIDDLSNIDTVWVKFVNTSYIAYANTFFVNGSFIMPNGLFFNESNPMYADQNLNVYDPFMYPTNYTCTSFKNLTEELVMYRCKKFKSVSRIFKKYAPDYKAIHTTYEMLPSCMKMTSKHNVKHLSFEFDELINCTSTPTTLTCYTQFPNGRDPIVISGFMSYTTEFTNETYIDRFIYAEIDNFKNETTIRGGEPYNENCVNLNDYNIKLISSESKSSKRWTTLCCQEYFEKHR